MSLREELKEIVQHARYNVMFTGIDTKEEKANLEFEVDQILETISKHLPEKKYLYSEANGGMKFENEEYGWYNQALTDINKLLTTNKKGSGV